MALLGVNVDHVATLRQARLTQYPDPMEAALLAHQGGADQITVHLREDRRHIQDKDIINIRNKVRLPLNLEMAATDEMLAKALEISPSRVTLVPEKRRELTTEGGLDVANKVKRLKKFVSTLRGEKIAVSIFIDPTQKQIDASIATGARALELHTGMYADAKSDIDKSNERERILIAARYANAHNLFVAAGHGLHINNIQPIASISEIREFNIGHSIISRALFIGIGPAVAEMKKAIAQAILSPS